LGFNYQEGRVGIQLSRGKGLRSNYQEGRIESQPFPLDDWIPTLPSSWLNPNPSLLMIGSQPFPLDNSNNLVLLVIGSLEND
jgi:hypothetical protein